MMKLALELPLNNLSLGSVSILLLRTIYEREKSGDTSIEWFLFPIGNVDLSAQNADQDFHKWIQLLINKSFLSYSRDIPIFKVWHLQGSLQSYSKNQTLLTFYELDNPTKVELNIARNNKLCLSSKYAQDVFNIFGVKSEFLPLAFDSFHYKKLDKKFYDDGRIVFNLCGKFEKRKSHAQVLKAWIKKYGGNPKYVLQCAIYNPFLGRNQQECDANNQEALKQILGNNNKPFNVNFIPHMKENIIYNDFLNSANIIIGMSGGEGFGLPEFQSVAIGKHAVILNAHAYKTWANSENATLVEPNGKTSSVDNIFFQQGNAFNQGQLFSFDDDDFIAGCEAAIKKVETNRVNENGLKLQAEYTKESFLNKVIELTK